MREVFVLKRTGLETIFEKRLHQRSVHGREVLALERCPW